jgi:hypothetical protein
MRDRVFANKQDFMLHLRQEHGLRRRELKTPRPDEFEIGSDPGLASRCMFCGLDVAGNDLDLARHVGRHVEEFAYSVTAK